MSKVGPNVWRAVSRVSVIRILVGVHIGRPRAVLEAPTIPLIEVAEAGGVAAKKPRLLHRQRARVEARLRQRAADERQARYRDIAGDGGMSGEPHGPPDQAALPG